MPDEILLTRDGDIATVTLRHPGKLNAITVAMWRELGRIMTGLSADESLRCVVLRGADGNFAAGADIEEFDRERNASYEQLLHYHEHVIRTTLAAVDGCLHPTVALIEGVCVGGGLEIASLCDLRIAAADARLGAPIGKLGFAMAHAELAGLVGLVGRAVALELLLEGRILDAGEALAKGLLTRVVPAAEAEREAYAAARRIASGAPLAARINKRLVRRLVPIAAPLTAAEIADNFAYYESEDFRAGQTAFVGKTRPDFKGR